MKRIFWLLVFLAVGAHAVTNIWIRTGEAYGIEPRLLYAISKVESNVRPLIISVNYHKLTKPQEQKLYTMLQNRNISYKIYSKEREIENCFQDVRDFRILPELTRETGRNSAFNS